MDPAQAIAATPVANYIYSFGGLAILLALALATADKLFMLSPKVTGWLLLLCGGLGGWLIQELELVTIPGEHTTKGHLLAIFIGAMSAMAAAGFSSTDLRSLITKSKGTT